MEPASLDEALARIGSAVARVERAVEAALLTPKAAEGDAALAASHEALRQRVGAALGELDALIAGLEG